ncbi:prevent-host-death family protein [Mesorhizobium sp. NFR06]|nr:prevent-host-death family protein [Mesorhizobium sp. NFR06]
MQTVNIHSAKTNLSRLVDRAANGEPFIIAKAGKPLVKVVPIDQPTTAQMRRVALWQVSFPSPAISTAWVTMRSNSCSA